MERRVKNRTALHVVVVYAFSNVQVGGYASARGLVTVGHQPHIYVVVGVERGRMALRATAGDTSAKKP